MSDFVQNFRSLVAPLGFSWPIIFVPIWQEFVFRYLPYRFFHLPTNNFWLVGIISSLVFASIHWYSKEWFIAFSFIGGLVLWWIMVKYGLIAAILLHSLANVAIWLLGLKDAIVK